MMFLSSWNNSANITGEAAQSRKGMGVSLKTMMLLPKNFDSRRAIELGNLIFQAYEQLEAFQQEKEWHLQEQYRLISPLTYGLNKSKELENDSWIGKHLPKILKNAKTDEVRLPVGFVAQKAGTLYVIFRGTKTPHEWMSNLKTKPVPHFIGDFGHVHEGFLSVYSDLRGQIAESVHRCQGARTIFVAGHSLGGAFATLAALDLDPISGDKVRAVYTFGSPRVGDRIFVEAFNRRFGNKSFRIANSSDIVTELPLPVPVANFYGGYFSHVDTPVIGNDQREDMRENHRMKTYLGLVSVPNRFQALVRRLTGRGA
jgi:predicted lipase